MALLLAVWACALARPASAQTVEQRSESRAERSTPGESEQATVSSGARLHVARAPVRARLPAPCNAARVELAAQDCALLAALPPSVARQELGRAHVRKHVPRLNCEEPPWR